MNHDVRTILDLASFIGPGGDDAPTPWAALAQLTAVAFPAMAARLASDPSLLDACFAARWSETLSVLGYKALLRAATEGKTEDELASALRSFASRHRLRIALREILPDSAGGASLEVCARELSDLASATIDVALAEAIRVVHERFGAPRRHDGAISTLCVIGMGKLGGRELNAGSDVDLVCFYDTDDGEAGEAPNDITLHEYWTRVVRRMVALLEEVTDEGAVWRVDLRLRPEGTRGPLVNSLSAMLSYYETWGRLWERAAWSRARPVAGDHALGDCFLRELEPFVFRRRVDPSIADSMFALVEQARLERGDVDRDLKLGPGGIRDLETSVQSLQLIWGGRNPSLRVRPTLEALDRLRNHGYVTEREAIDLGEAYTLLRSAEHVVQNATGVQTHATPADPAAVTSLARCLGYTTAEAFQERLRTVRERVCGFRDGLRSDAVHPDRWTLLYAAIDRGDRREVREQLREHLGPMATDALARDVAQLGSRPNVLLGALAREGAPEHATALLDALVESADPEQAARCLAAWSLHRGFRPVHDSAFREPPALIRRFVTALGGSAFLGELIVGHPEIAEHVLFSRGMPSVEAAASAVLREVNALGEEATEAELVAGAIRRAKMRVTLEVALADIAEEVGVTEVTRVLSALADACVRCALRAVAGDSTEGFCVLSVGKLGGRELGYGSDLDVLFVFEPGPGEDEDDVMPKRARQARRTIQILSSLHADGPGYELDTRLRPSGSQGVLVTSVRAFARYHGLEETDGLGIRAAPWERQTLLRARHTAGDEKLAERVLALAHRAAYESGAPELQEIHRLRMRLEEELGHERAGRYDIKLGAGGLVDVEFAVQAQQMLHGAVHDVRRTGTLEAIDALESCGAVAGEDAAQLRESYAFLRKLEQRLHVVHNTSIHLLEASAPGLVPLARRLGFTSGPGRSAADLLMDRYRAVTRATRETYRRLLRCEE